ncbi:MAG: hypothetical protein H6940_09800 [Burkholderiales bacterium]|uniref:DUF5752 family protein n=1 Tax=Nitrosomonas sp. TaxID=42353 RepID=UPI001D2D9301|nr:DUF5752 family protein [Nitrosomonas sp.]MCB1949124.1 hypothetical protein [Nitrosomonas sp.]MCP5243707.1 hypothetical protein [Burkholderiales bacterium]
MNTPGAAPECTASDSVSRPGPFFIKDCALVALATGRRARMLQEFRNEITQIDESSIYHHYWGGLLQARFEEREFNNDFAAWVRHGIHDAILAERLAALDPTDFTDLESLRHEIIELIDMRLDECESLLWMRATQQFEFIRSQIIVFDTTWHLRQPAELASAIEQFSTSSIFYHFIDARRRTSHRCDDFSDWLAGFGADFMTLRERIAGIDPYFGSLTELRAQLGHLFKTHFRERGS